MPGLMPILNLQQIQRITGLCGATIPKPLLARLEAAGDDDSQVLRIGIEHTVAQSRELLARGVPGIHFYVLNRDFHIAEIIGRLS